MHIIVSNPECGGTVHLGEVCPCPCEQADRCLLRGKRNSQFQWYYPECTTNWIDYFAEQRVINPALLPRPSNLKCYVVSDLYWCGGLSWHSDACDFCLAYRPCPPRKPKHQLAYEKGLYPACYRPCVPFYDVCNHFDLDSAECCACMNENGFVDYIE